MPTTCDARSESSAAWKEPERWTRMSILNTARAGKFSSDRSIREYCETIWKISPAEDLPWLRPNRSRLIPRAPGRAFRRVPRSCPSGINFCIFSRHATRVELLLYANADSPEPIQVIVLSPEHNRSFFYWHVLVEGLPAGTCYTWRADGPQDTRETGHAFNPRKELLDPCARAVTDTLWDRLRAADPQDDGHASLRAVVTEPTHARARQARRAASTARSSTSSTSAGSRAIPRARCEHPGTFAGLVEKIPYLRELGVTHVELMPVMAFDEQDVPASVAARGLRNYWGYSPHSFYSPHPRYCIDPKRGRAGIPRAGRCLARRPASACCSTWCSTTPPRAARTDRRSTSRAWRTTSSTTSMRPTGAAIATTPVAETPSTATTPR